MNAEFQRIARRDKKAFLSDQCKEIEENNRMGKTRDLFKKLRYTKGIFHAKMGTIKDRNCINVTEAEEIKKRWQEHTEELKLKKVGKTTTPFRYDLKQILYDYTVEVTNRFTGLDLTDRVPEEL